jgi:hypothetical protein
VNHFAAAIRVVQLLVCGAGIWPGIERLDPEPPRNQRAGRWLPEIFVAGLAKNLIDIGLRRRENVPGGLLAIPVFV